MYYLYISPEASRKSLIHKWQTAQNKYKNIISYFFNEVSIKSLQTDQKNQE
jgi:hypothetical protein